MERPKLQQISFQEAQTSKNTKFQRNGFKAAKKDCSYEGEALNVLTAFHGLWSSVSFETYDIIFKNEKTDFFLKPPALVLLSVE